MMINTITHDTYEKSSTSTSQYIQTTIPQNRASLQDDTISNEQDHPSTITSSPTPSNAPLIPLIVIVGSTSVGKTKLSIDLAKVLDGEVVNADSMQIYSGLDIGSAKAD